MYHQTNRHPYTRAIKSQREIRLKKKNRFIATICSYKVCKQQNDENENTDKNLRERKKKKKIRSTFEDTGSRFHLSSDWSAEWLDGCLLAQFCQIQFPPCIFFIAFQLQSVKSRIWPMHTYKSIQFLIAPRN